MFAQGINERPVNLLLVEDSRSDALLVQKAFNGLATPVNFTLAETVDQGLDALYQRNNYSGSPRPDLILLDLNLFGRSGKEVLEEVKKNESLRMIPVIVLSGSCVESDILDCYRMQGNCFLPKPQNMENYAQIAMMFEEFWFQRVLLADVQDKREGKTL